MMMMYIPERERLFTKLDEINSSRESGYDTCYTCGSELDDDNRLMISQNLEIYLCKECATDTRLFHYIQHLKNRNW